MGNKSVLPGQALCHLCEQAVSYATRNHPAVVEYRVSIIQCRRTHVRHHFSHPLSTIGRSFASRACQTKGSKARDPNSIRTAQLSLLRHTRDILRHAHD